MFKFKNLTYWGVVFALITAFGCTKTFYIKDPSPSSVVYSQGSQEKLNLRINDQRSGEDKKLSAGTLPVVLVNMEDEIFFLGTNLEAALISRGINLHYSSDADGGLVLDVDKYRIRNLRTTGFSPYWTFTTFAGDLKQNGDSRRVVFYFKRGKVPVWAFREVEDPCYNVPVSLMVKEIASKINRYYFGLQASDDKIKSLVDDINNQFDEFSFLKVLELGYTNNPAAIESLVALTHHQDSMVRVCATCSLGVLGAVDQFDYLKELYNTKKNIEKTMALKAIGDLGTPEALDFIQSVKVSSDYNDDMIREVVDLFI
jgi:hypothetical protein